MDYKIENLEEMILMQTDGHDRKEAREKLENHLKEIGVEAVKYFYLEAFRNGEVSGAMALALLAEEPEHSRKFPSAIMKPSPYFIADLSYEELIKSETGSKEDKIDFVSIIKQEGYKIGALPFYEFINENDIRIYVKLD